MKKLYRKFWGWPSRYRTAYSMTLGIVFGLAIPFTSFWYLLLIIVFFIRTHLVSAITGWAIGFSCYFACRNLYEPLGRKFLIPYDSFWQKFFSCSIFSCLDLRYADVMGSVIFALLAALGAIIIITIFRIIK